MEAEPTPERRRGQAGGPGPLVEVWSSDRLSGPGAQAAGRRVTAQGRHSAWDIVIKSKLGQLGLLHWKNTAPKRGFLYKKELDT